MNNGHKRALSGYQPVYPVKTNTQVPGSGILIPNIKTIPMLKPKQGKGSIVYNIPYKMDEKRCENKITVLFIWQNFKFLRCDIERENESEKNKKEKEMFKKFKENAYARNRRKERKRWQEKEKKKRWKCVNKRKNGWREKREDRMRKMSMIIIIHFKSLYYEKREMRMRQDFKMVQNEKEKKEKEMK